MSDALFQEAYKIDIAARKNLKKSDAEADININVTEMRDGAIAEGEGGGFEPLRWFTGRFHYRWVFL